MIEDFKPATIRAIRAGFDGVEIHGANTYLVQQFFSPHSNRRTDQWGGTLEKRTHFIELLVDAVTGAVDQFAGGSFIVGYRFSPEEYEEPGIKLADTLYLVDLLAEKPLDYLHISLNDYHRVSVSKDYQEASMLEYVHDRIAGRLPLIGVGDVRSKQDAEAILAHGEVVAVGRSLLIDPHWTKKVLEGKEETLRTVLPAADRNELLIQNGVWGFLEAMMPDRLV